MKCSCKGCERRTTECHATCEEYKEWVKWRDERNRLRTLDRERFNTQSEAAHRMITESLRRKRA